MIEGFQGFIDYLIKYPKVMIAGVTECGLEWVSRF